MTRTFRDDLQENLRDLEFAKRFGVARAKSNFAITLAEARRQLNLTQQQLAARLGVSQSYVAKLESGEANPTLERIGSLLAMLGLSLTVNTTTLSPYPETLLWETDWAPDASLVESAIREAIFMSEATKARSSSRIKREVIGTV